MSLSDKSVTQYDRGRQILAPYIQNNKVRQNVLKYSISIYLASMEAYYVFVLHIANAISILCLGPGVKAPI